MNIRSRQIECFLSLAQTLSFSQTGKELQIAQPAVTKHIQKLEQQLQTQLFIRNKKSVELTKQAKELYLQISPYWNGLESNLQSFKNKAQSISGTINFATLTEIGEKIVVPKLSEFINDYPKLNLRVQFQKTVEIVEGIKNGSIDLAITPENIIDEQVRTYKIMKEEIVLVTSKGKKKPSEPISKLPFIAYRPNDPLLFFYLKKVSPRTQISKVNIPITVNSHKSIVDFLKLHPYYAVLPKHSIKDALKNKEVSIVSSKTIESPMYLIHRELEISDPKITLLKDFLYKNLKANS